MNSEEMKERKCFGDVRNGVRAKREGMGKEKKGKNFPPIQYLSCLGLGQ